MFCESNQLLIIAAGCRYSSAVVSLPQRVECFLCPSKVSLCLLWRSELHGDWEKRSTISFLSGDEMDALIQEVSWSVRWACPAALGHVMKGHRSLWKAHLWPNTSLEYLDLRGRASYSLETVPRASLPSSIKLTKTWPRSFQGSLLSFPLLFLK